MKKVLVTGANGQLGMCIREAAHRFPEMTFHFAGRDEFDLKHTDAMDSYFAKHRFQACINTAAYTSVEEAEEERDLAFEVNAYGVENLAKICGSHNVELIHISTDYVFDGTKTKPYVEEDGTNPINVYGASKLEGERLLKEHCDRHYILRTSWLYSQFGHNFYKSVQKWANEGRDLTVTIEQTGVPTNANDLADVLLKVVSADSGHYGLYHASNTGEATWFDFAEAILVETGQISTINLAKTDHYRTFAARPEYSVLDTSKLKQVFGLELPHWRKSLEALNSNHK